MQLASGEPIPNSSSTLAMKFVLLANGVAALLGMMSGGSLLTACIFLFFAQLAVFVIGVPLWIRECRILHWRRNTCVFLLLFTPYIVGLGAATLLHHQYHRDREAEAADGSKARAINLPAPVLEP